VAHLRSLSCLSVQIEMGLTTCYSSEIASLAGRLGAGSAPSEEREEQSSLAWSPEMWSGGAQPARIPPRQRQALAIAAQALRQHTCGLIGNLGARRRGNLAHGLGHCF
jgi:hypothetical protein